MVNWFFYYTCAKESISIAPLAAIRMCGVLAFPQETLLRHYPTLPAIAAVGAMCCAEHLPCVRHRSITLQLTRGAVLQSRDASSQRYQEMPVLRALFGARKGVDKREKKDRRERQLCLGKP